MKTTLMIEAEPSELARILATLGASASVVAMTGIPGVGATGNADDDESGDTAAAPGATDKNGLPWDERIHSTPMKLTGKGVWRAKRGVSDALVTQVEAELRSRPQQPAPVPQMQPQPVMQQPVPQPQPQPLMPQPIPQMQQPAPVYQPPQPMFDAGTPANIPAQIPGAATHSAINPPVPQQPTQIAQTQVAPGTLDFNTFMGKVQQIVQLRDPNGNAIAGANYFASVAQRVGQAFGVNLGSIAEFGADQRYVDYAAQIMSSEGRWV